MPLSTVKLVPIFTAPLIPTPPVTTTAPVVLLVLVVVPRNVPVVPYTLPNKYGVVTFPVVTMTLDTLEIVNRFPVPVVRVKLPSEPSPITEPPRYSVCPLNQISLNLLPLVPKLYVMFALGTILPVTAMFPPTVKLPVVLSVVNAPEPGVTLPICTACRPPMLPVFIVAVVSVVAPVTPNVPVTTALVPT